MRCIILKNIIRRFLGPPATANPKSKQDNQELNTLRALAEKGEWKQLEEKAKNSLSSDASNCGETIGLLSYSQQQLGHYDKAVEYALKAIELSPSTWLPNFIAGVSYKKLNQASAACDYLRRASTLNPKDQQTLTQLLEASTIVDGINNAAKEYEARTSAADLKCTLLTAKILSVRSWAEDTKTEIQEAGEIEEIPFTEPNVFGISSPPKTYMAPSNKPYVATLKNACVFSGSSIILTEDGYALSDTAGHPIFGSAVSFSYDSLVLAQSENEVLLDLSSYQTKSVGSAIMMAGLTSNAFGHWLPEFLPKLEFFQQHPNFDQLPLIIDSNMPESHVDHLRRLCGNQLIELGPNECFICDQLLIAPSPAFSPIELFQNNIPIKDMPGLSPRAMRFLQPPPQRNNNRNKRLFLARKGMQWRKLINEHEIASDLEQLGFETVYLETMSTKEQIELFQQADIIVAPNGSALLNLIFAAPEVKLLVLTQPNLFNWGTFQGPMDALGYKSVCVCGQYAINTSEKHSDYTVDKGLIRRALAGFGIYNER